MVLYLAAMEASPKATTKPQRWTVRAVAAVLDDHHSAHLGHHRHLDRLPDHRRDEGVRHHLAAEQSAATREQAHVIATRMVQTMFTEFRVGEAAALAVLLFLMVFIGSAATMTGPKGNGGNVTRIVHPGRRARADRARIRPHLRLAASTGAGRSIPMFWLLYSSFKAGPRNIPSSVRVADDAALGELHAAWVSGHFGDYFLNSVILTVDQRRDHDIPRGDDGLCVRAVRVPARGRSCFTFSPG